MRSHGQNKLIRVLRDEGLAVGRHPWQRYTWHEGDRLRDPKLTVNPSTHLAKERQVVEAHPSLDLPRELTLIVKILRKMDARVEAKVFLHRNDTLCHNLLIVLELNNNVLRKESLK